MVGQRFIGRLPAGSRERWKQYGFRAAILLALLVMAAGFIRSVVVRPPAAVSAGNTQQADLGSQAFAARFTVDFLSYDEGQPDQHRQRLQSYLPDGVDPMLGWDGKGKQQVWAGPYVVDLKHRERLAWVGTASMVSGNRWVYLDVPVGSSSQGSYVIPGAPVFRPAPSRANWAMAGVTSRVDPDMTGQRKDDVGAFFKAYGASSLDLSYFEEVPGRYPGLAGAVSFDSLSNLVVYEGGSEREALAVVRWHEEATGATYTQSYRLRLKHVGEKWLVSDIGPAVATNGGIS